MYQLSDSIIEIKGIGQKHFETLQKHNIHSVQDLLLFVPYRYEDRSKRVAIQDLFFSEELSDPKKMVTLALRVKSARDIFAKGRRMQRAELFDDSGEITATWFNNPFIIRRLKSGEQYLFSGTIKQFGRKIFLTQPLVENMSDDTIHTDRLVPIYSSTIGIKPTILRRILKEAIDNVDHIVDPLQAVLPRDILGIENALKQVHFPDQEEEVEAARRRFALDELLGLIDKSQKIKNEWKHDKRGTTFPSVEFEKLIPPNLPFQLTSAQQKCSREILDDLTNPTPMNRLLIGDVGSGKTIVAGLAIQQVIKNKTHACLIAPTQMLAGQHLVTFQKFFPKMNIQLVTSTSKNKIKLFDKNIEPTLFIGTHAVLNILEKEKSVLPIGLIIFDEQHRFGVNQRSSIQFLTPHPHILTMTATPIPRSLMLTLFSHLHVSTIDELPANRIPTKTWLISSSKKNDMFHWISEQITGEKESRNEERKTRNEKRGTKNPRQNFLADSQKTSTGKQPAKNLSFTRLTFSGSEREKFDGQATYNFLTLYICPFIDPSDSQAFENVAAAKEKFESICKAFPKTTRIRLLHGRMKQQEKNEVITALYQSEVDILVTTPIIEVGVDLPQASAIVIESAERFGLASLHQLRGRVGRAGQQGYCILIPSNQNQITSKRLQQFTQEHNGLKLAELDLQRRGAGDLFGVTQHGFDELQFASWADLELISLAKNIHDNLEKDAKTYSSVLKKNIMNADAPLAN